MLVVFGHTAPNTPAGFLPTPVPNTAMPTMYAVGSGVGYGLPQCQFVNQQQQRRHSKFDASTKLGAPLKQQAMVNSAVASFNSNNATPLHNPLYKTQHCHSYRETGQCNYRLKCQYAHGDEELRPVPHHQKYKTELCRNFHTSGICNYGERCHYVHNEPMPISHPAAALSPRNVSRPSTAMANPTLAAWINPTLAAASDSRRRPTNSVSVAERRFAPTATAAVPPLTIPTQHHHQQLTDNRNGAYANGTPYCYEAPPSSLGSVCSSSNQSFTSGTDSPPPSGSSCDHSPVSYSPGLLPMEQTYQQLQNRQHFSPHQLPQQHNQQWPHGSGYGDEAFQAARRVFSYWTDTSSWPNGNDEACPLNTSGQRWDLDQLMVNLRGLSVCRQDSSAPNGPGWDFQTSPAESRPQFFKSSIMADRRQTELDDSSDTIRMVCP